MRLPLIIGLVVVTVALCVGGGVIWHSVLWREGWFRAAPTIARGLPGLAGADSGPWTRRLAQQFPIGSSEVKLADVLGKQGFIVDPKARRAAYGWAVYPCVYTLTVTWQGDELQRVRGIVGGLLNACTDPKYLLPDRPARGPRSGYRPPDQTQPRQSGPSLVPARQSA